METQEIFADIHIFMQKLRLKRPVFRGRALSQPPRRRDPRGKGPGTKKHRRLRELPQTAVCGSKKRCLCPGQWPSMAAGPGKPGGQVSTVNVPDLESDPPS